MVETSQIQINAARQNIRQAQREVAVRESQASQAQEQVISPRVARQLDIQGMRSRNIIVEQLGQEQSQLKEASKNISQYEQQLQDYLKTPSGIIQYSQEQGIAPTVKTETKGYSIGGVVVPYTEILKTYTTPYGSYTSKESNLSEQVKELAQSREMFPIEIKAPFGVEVIQTPRNIEVPKPVETISPVTLDVKPITMPSRGTISNQPNVQFISNVGEPQGFIPFAGRTLLEVGRIPIRAGGFVSEQIAKTNINPYTIPERKVFQPQMVTIGAPPTYVIPEQKTSVSEQVGKAAGIVTIGGIYYSQVGNLFLGASALGGTIVALNPKETTQERISAGIEAGLAGGLLGYQGYKALTKPIVTVEKFKPKSSYIEAIQPVGDKMLSKYEMTTTQPAPKITATNLWRQLTLQQPVVEGTISKPQVYKTYPIDFVDIAKPYEAITTKVGSNVYKVSRISGESVPLDIKTFEALPKAQQYVWQQIVEKQLGTPVPLKQVPNVLSRNFNYITSNIQSQDLYKLTKQGRTIKIDFKAPIEPSYKITRTGENAARVDITLPKVNRFTTGTGTRPIGETPQQFTYGAEYLKDVAGNAPRFPISIKEELPQGFTGFTSETLYKRISSNIPTPLPRATGKVSSLKGITFQLPSRSGVVEDVGTTIVGSGQKSSQTFISGLTQAAKVIPKVPQVSVPKFVTSAAKQTATTTTERVVLGSAMASKAIQVQKPQQLQIEQTQFKQPQDIIQENKVIEVFKPTQKFVDAIQFKQPQAELPVQKFVTPQLEKQLQKQIQVEKLQTATPTPNITQRVIVPKPPVIVPDFTLGKKAKEAAKKSIISKRQAYILLVKRRGKFLEQAKGLPLGRALKAGVDITTSTLARTFKLVPQGTTDSFDISYSPSSSAFRPPRSPSQLTYVQKVALSRGTGEVPEIMRARRTASIFTSKPSRRNRRRRLI